MTTNCSKYYRRGTRAAITVSVNKGELMRVALSRLVAKFLLWRRLLFKGDWPGSRRKLAGDRYYACRPRVDIFALIDRQYRYFCYDNRVLMEAPDRSILSSLPRLRRDRDYETEFCMYAEMWRRLSFFDYPTLFFPDPSASPLLPKGHFAEFKWLKLN